MSLIWQPGVKLCDVEKNVINLALKFFQGNKEATAQSLGVSVRTIDNKLKKYKRENEEAKNEEV